MRRGYIRRVRPTVEPGFYLVGVADLTFDEQTAVEAALAEQKKSTNPKWRVGVAALAYDGRVVAIHNHTIGPQNHGEQLAVSEFYKRMPAGQKRIKTLVVAGARAGEEVIRCNGPYGDNVRALDDIEPSVRICGKCGEFLHDCTFNVPDVEILLVTVTGEILKTSLRSLFPMIHTSFTVPIKTEQVDDGAGGKRWVVYPVPSTEEHKENANCNGIH